MTSLQVKKHKKMGEESRLFHLHDDSRVSYPISNENVEKHKKYMLSL